MPMLRYIGCGKSSPALDSSFSGDIAAQVSGRREEVTLSVLNRICVALDVNIGDVMEFTNDERDGEYDS